VRRSNDPPAQRVPMATSSGCSPHRAAVRRVGRAAGAPRRLRRRRLTIAESVTEVAGKLEFGTPKSHQHRSLPLPAALVDPLAARCEGKQGDDLLLTTSAGTALRLRNWRRVVFDPAVRAAGLTDITPHDLRHRRLTRGGQWRDGQERSADARTRLGGHDLGRPLRPLRRRPHGSGRADGRRCAGGRRQPCGRLVGAASGQPSTHGRSRWSTRWAPWGSNPQPAD
jgi:hypothetical protein